MLSILVKTSCQSDRIWECDTEYLFLKGWCLFLVNASHDGSGKWNMSEECKRGHDHVVSRFGVEAEKNGLKKVFVHKL